MVIYGTLIAIILLSKFLLDSKKFSKLQYCILIGVAFTLVTGLRGVDVGADTTVYYLGYESLKRIDTFSQLYATHKSDFAYYLFTWVLGKLGAPFWVVTLSVSALFYYSVSKIIYKFSEDVSLSYLLLMAFNFFQFSMTGIRQTIAFSFVLLVLYDVYDKKFKFTKTIILILLGSWFHLSCLISLLIIPIALSKKTSTPMKLIITIFALALGFLFRSSLADIIFQISEDTRFNEFTAENSGGGITTYLVYFGLYILGLFYYNKYCSNFQKGQIDFKILFLGILFLGLVPVQSIMFRLAWYFSIILIIYLPRLLNTMNIKEQVFVQPMVYAAVLYMYFFITKSSAAVLPYSFFWN